MVEEAFRPGVVVTEAARRLGVHESLLYRWRGLMKATETAAAEPSSFVAVTITPEPTVTEPPVVEPPDTKSCGLRLMRRFPWGMGA